MTIKLIVGLRNPGPNYVDTRHNVGGLFVETLASHYNLIFKADKKLHSELCQAEINSNECRLLLPLVFMNQSGLPVKAVCQFYRILPNEILVVHDDLDLAAGRIKLKIGGGHGGHNGLRDLISHLSSSDFNRLRIGIGHPGHKDLVLNYVLGKPSQHDRQLMIDAIDRGIDVMPKALSGDISNAMSLLNG